MYLDPADPAALEAAMEALPLATVARVVTGGEEFTLHRVPGGWHLPGDLTVASADVAGGRPSSVEVVNLDGEDPYDEEDGR